MKVGIVGHEQKKFTVIGEALAKVKILWLLDQDGVTEVVSGGCHLGGVDIWAEEIGRELGLKVTVFKPTQLSWCGENGFMARNLQIADHSDIVHCIVVDKLPKKYAGKRFEYCYHCDSKEHVKSGGCWTMNHCKHGQLHVIRQGKYGETS